MRVLRKKRLTDLTPDDFRGKALLLDIDNTLALQDDNTPYRDTQKWCKEMENRGFSLIVVSNNGEERVSRFAAQYSLPFVFGARKPLSFGYKRAMKALGVRKKDCTAVGDQIFTDLLGALFSGIDMVLLEPIEEEKSGFLKFKRMLDNFFRKIIFGRWEND